MNKKIVSIVSISIIALLITFGTSLVKGKDTDELTVGEEIRMIYSGDFPLTNNLEEMYNEADVIVIGSYESLDSKWNMARDPKNIEKEDLNNYTEGHLYNFKVEEVLYGQADANIKINLRYEEVVEIEDNKKKKHKITNKDQLYMEPKLGEKYLVFLKLDPFGNYFGAIEPFQMLIHPDNTVELQTNLEEEHRMIETVIDIENSENVAVIYSELPELEDQYTGKTISEIKEAILSFKK